MSIRVDEVRVDEKGTVFNHPRCDGMLHGDADVVALSDLLLQDANCPNNVRCSRSMLPWLCEL